MIQNLNPITFNKYGKITKNKFDCCCKKLFLSEFAVKNINIYEKNIKYLYKTQSSNIIIDKIDGIALICVSDNLDNKNIKIFLLDKTIIIKPNIYYRIISLSGTNNIKIAYLKNTIIEKYIINEKIVPYSIYPKVEINKVHTLFYQEKELNFKFKGEKHDFWELTYVDKGKLLTKVNDTTYKLEQGQVIFYAPNQYHNQKGLNDISVCFMTITFDMHFDDSDFFTYKVFNVTTELKNILQKILAEKNNKSYYSDDLIICYIKEFIIKLIRSVKLEHTLNHVDTDIQNNIENSIVLKSINYIQNNIDKKLTIPDIAANIPISSSYLSKIFKKHTKITIIEYINNYKLEKSKELIRTSNYNFTQISSLLGYNSVHYFSKQFKKHYEVSPTQYSKSIKQQ